MPKLKSPLTVTVKRPSLGRRLGISGSVRRTIKPSAGLGEIDMVAAIGGDFGCVQSKDVRTVREKLVSLGRGIDS